MGTVGPVEGDVGQSPVPADPGGHGEQPEDRQDGRPVGSGRDLSPQVDMVAGISITDLAPGGVADIDVLDSGDQCGRLVVTDPWVAVTDPLIHPVVQLLPPLRHRPQLVDLGETGGELSRLGRRRRGEGGGQLVAGLVFTKRSGQDGVGGDDGLSWEDRLPTKDDESGAADTRIALLQAVATLTAREQRVVALRFGQDLTQTQIAAQLGISQMQVSRLLTQILATLRGQARAAPHHTGGLTQVARSVLKTGQIPRVRGHRQCSATILFGHAE